MKSRQFNLENSKLEMVKTIGAHRELDSILVDIKINQLKLVNICGYKLATNLQNFTEVYSLSENIAKKVLGATFLTHTVERPKCVCGRGPCCSVPQTPQQHLRPHIFMTERGRKEKNGRGGENTASGNRLLATTLNINIIINLHRTA